MYKEVAIAKDGTHHLQLHSFWALDQIWLQHFTGGELSLQSNVEKDIQIDKDGIVSLDIIGPISYYNAFYSFFFGEPTVEGLLASLDFIESKKQIKAVMLRIDSPGGVATGITELTDRLQNFSKPIYVWGNNVASAALLTAAAADKFFVGPMSLVGSVGVVYVEHSLNSENIRTTKIVSKNAPLKALEANTKDGKNTILNCINALEDVFIDRLSTYRGISAQQIKESWGKGALLPAEQALSVGMIDGIMGFEQAKGELRKTMSATEEPTPLNAQPTPQIAQDMEQRFKAMLEEQNKTNQQALAAQQQKFEATQQQEVNRKKGITNIFEMFNGDPHQEQYLLLQAQCLADTDISQEEARQKVIQLRGNFASVPISNVIPTAQTPDAPKEAVTAEALLAKIRSEGNKTEGEAMLYLATEHPEQYQKYMEELNPDAHISWTKEGKF